MVYFPGKKGEGFRSRYVANNVRTPKIIQVAAGLAVSIATVITLTVFFKISKNQLAAPATEQGNVTPAPIPTIEVIEYQGKRIPVSEVIMVFEPMGGP